MMKPNVAAAALPDDQLDPEIRQSVRLMSQRWRQHPPLMLRTDARAERAR